MRYSETAPLGIDPKLQAALYHEEVARIALKKARIAYKEARIAFKEAEEAAFKAELDAAASL